MRIEQDEDGIFVVEVDASDTSADTLDAFDELRATLNLDDATADAWIARIRDDRRKGR